MAQGKGADLLACPSWDGSGPWHTVENVEVLGHIRVENLVYVRVDDKTVFTKILRKIIGGRYIKCHKKNQNKNGSFLEKIKI